MRAVRGSELSDFLRCRYKWSESWINGLKPKKPQTALLFGSAMHKFFEDWYNNFDADEAIKAIPDYIDSQDTSSMDEVELNELVDLAVSIAENYIDQWDEQDSQFNVIGTEVHFRIPLDEHISFEGTIDLIYEDQDGNLWFADHKTTGSIEKYEKNAIMDRQISRYWWALEQLAQGNGQVYDEGIDTWFDIRDADALYKKIYGQKVHGFIYNLILKDVPKPPKVLKSGGLSKDKSQKTTFEMYIKALIEQGLYSEEGDNCYAWPEDYKDILQLLLDQETKYGNRFFKRIPVYRLQQEVDASIREFYYTAKELDEIAEDVNIGVHDFVYRNITQDCAWCAYQSICAAGIEGSDVEHIRQTLYVTEEK